MNLQLWEISAADSMKDLRLAVPPPQTSAELSLPFRAGYALSLRNKDTSSIQSNIPSMMQTEREMLKAAQVRKGMLLCTSEISKASLPKEQGQPWLQMKPEQDISQRGIPALNTSKVSPQIRIKTIKIITMHTESGGGKKLQKVQKVQKKNTIKKQTATLPGYSCLSWR